MIMANIRLQFYGTRESETQDHSLECFANAVDDIYISIDMGDFPASHICLDVPTAIRLSKTLRTEINKIKEVQNG
jgi:hypothetical protein